MSHLKVFLNWVGVFCLVFSSSFAQASTAGFQDQVDFFNNDKSLSGFTAPLKDQFKTKEDHRQIDAVASQIGDKADKWIWRFEIQGPDKVAMRVNGKIQAVAEQVNSEENSFVINGHKIQLRKGESFLSFNKNVLQALTKKTAFYDQLFFSEAHAFALLAVFAGLAIGAMVLSKANAGSRCEVEQNPIAHTLQPARGKFLRGVKCSSMKRSYQARMYQVIPNFKSNGKFNTSSSARMDEVCVAKFNSLGRPTAVQICKCVHRKQLACQSGGWNMLEEMAEQTCLTAFRHHAQGCSRQPVPGYVDTPVPAPRCDKVGGCHHVDTPVPDAIHQKTSQ